MPDRRQADRREGGRRKLTISLSSFIFIVLIAIIIIAAIIICCILTKKAYNNGYSQALIDEAGQSSYYNQSDEDPNEKGFSALGTSEIDVNEIEYSE